MQWTHSPIDKSLSYQSGVSSYLIVVYALCFLLSLPGNYLEIRLSEEKSERRELAFVAI